MKPRRCLLLFTLVLLCPLFAQVESYRGATDSDALDRIVANFEVKDARIADAIAQLLMSNGVPGGVALQATCDSQHSLAESKRSFHLVNLTLRQALDEVLRKYPGYKWEEQDHSIVVVPDTGMPKMLRTRVKRLQIDNPHYTISAASGEILQLPEIKQRMAQLGLREGLQYLIGGVDKRDLLKTKISLSDVSMYEALNAIAQANSVVWRYSEFHCQAVNTLSITWVRP